MNKPALNKGAETPLNKGQTLIETLAALFILVMGITAAVALAIYALNSSTSITRQIVATGLAREGIEAVKNMRDTNWLNDTLAVNGCYNFQTATNDDADCFLNWLEEVYCIDPSTGLGACNGNAAENSYALGLDSGSSPLWTWTRQNPGGGERNYALLFTGSATTTSGGFYRANGAECITLTTNPSFCRKIVIQVTDNVPPYNEDVGPLLFVKSQVWWTDRKCPRVLEFSQANPGCRIELDTYLTNWKNYSY